MRCSKAQLDGDLCLVKETDMVCILRACVVHQLRLRRALHTPKDSTIEPSTWLAVSAGKFMTMQHAVSHLPSL